MKTLDILFFINYDEYKKETKGGDEEKDEGIGS